jgi:Skp family chaperone for outer membrane proteins
MIKFLSLSLTLVVLIACSSKENPKKDTQPKVEVQPLDGLKIAYYSNDSVKKHFEYFKKEEAALKKMQKQFETQLKKLNANYEAYVVKKDQEARAGLLSENEIMAAQQKAQQLQATIMEFQQREGARIEKETMKSLETINKKVTSWGKKYSEVHHIDLLLIQDPGGQINYINPKMDVTEAFINYLNENQSKIEKEL